MTSLLDDLSESSLLGQHGLSLLVEVEAAGEKIRILLDTGQDSSVVLSNMDRLGLDPTVIDAIILSHCHYDHTGGLVGILSRIGREVPVVAHPAVLRENWKLKPVRSIGFGESAREEIRRAGGRLLLVSEPLPLSEGVITTGEVPRVTPFEEQGVGSYNLEGGRLVPDTIPDDMALAVNLGDRGLFVVTGCSHSGIVNILRRSVETSGVERVFGLAGGLHLKDADQGRIEATVTAMADFGPEVVAAGHCTGLSALAELSRRFGDRFHRLKTGDRLEY